MVFNHFQKIAKTLALDAVTEWQQGARLAQPDQWAIPLYTKRPTPSFRLFKSSVLPGLAPSFYQFFPNGLQP